MRVTGLKVRAMLAATLMAPCLAFSQTAAEESEAVTAPLGLSNLLGLVTSLVLVIGAILFVGWSYSKMRGVSVGASNVINVLAAQALGPKERIIVVQIGSQQLAIGVTPSSLQTLHVFENPVIQSQEHSAPNSFAARFRTALGSFGSK